MCFLYWRLGNMQLRNLIALLFNCFAPRASSKIKPLVHSCFNVNSTFNEPKWSTFCKNFDTSTFCLRFVFKKSKLSKGQIFFVYFHLWYQWLPTIYSIINNVYVFNEIINYSKNILQTITFGVGALFYKMPFPCLCFRNGFFFVVRRNN